MKRGLLLPVSSCSAMIHHSGIRLLLVSAIVLASLAVSFGQTKAGDLKLEPYVFENSRKEKTDAEFGRLFVPENRSNPKSRLIELAFVRFKSTSKNPGAPIIYLAGGPGGSGIAAAKGSRFPLFMAMREIGDVIAFDQRGTGDSKPNIGCRGSLELPPDKAVTYEEVLRALRANSRSCADYWRSQGADLSGYNTNESADDIEDLRKALGAKKVSLWGISYGTHLSFAAIRRHERNIERVILAGTEGPDSTLKLPGDVQQHLADIDRYVKADANLSKQIPDLLGLMRSVFERLEREPVTVEVTDPKTRETVKVVVNKFALQLLTATFVGTDAIMFYPRVYLAASKGDYSEIAQQWLGLTRTNLNSAMSLMMDCASGASRERLRRIEREAQGTLLEKLADFVFPDICDAWGSPDLGHSFRAPIKSDVPALFISGTLDGRTPVSNAEEARRGFRNSQHLIIEGAWHSDPLFLSSPKIKDVMLEFMRGAPLSTTRITLPPPKFASLKSE